MSLSNTLFLHVTLTPPAAFAGCSSTGVQKPSLTHHAERHLLKEEPEPAEGSLAPPVIHSSAESLSVRALNILSPADWE